MGRTVYLPTLKTHKNQRTNLGKYTSLMDPMGFSNWGVIFRFYWGVIKGSHNSYNSPPKKTLFVGGNLRSLWMELYNPWNGGERKIPKNCEKQQVITSISMMLVFFYPKDNTVYKAICRSGSSNPIYNWWGGPVCGGGKRVNFSRVLQKSRKKKMLSVSGWWFQPLWNILVKLDHFPSLGVKFKHVWVATI